MHALSKITHSFWNICSCHVFLFPRSWCAQFYREVTKVVPAPLQDDVDSDTTATEEASSHHHANWCAVQWNHVIPTIRLWKQAVDDAVEPSNGKVLNVLLIVLFSFTISLSVYICDSMVCIETLLDRLTCFRFRQYVARRGRTQKNPKSTTAP